MELILIVAVFIIGFVFGILTTREVYKVRLLAKINYLLQRKNQLINDYPNAASRRELNLMISEVEALELVLKTLQTLK